MVITINNGNLVCKWLETPGRARSYLQFPSILRQESSRPSTRAVSHIEMPWVNICLRSCKLILFKCQVWEQKGAFGPGNLIALSRFLRDNDRFFELRETIRHRGGTLGPRPEVKGNTMKRVPYGMSTLERPRSINIWRSCLTSMTEIFMMHAKKCYSDL